MAPLFTNFHFGFGRNPSGGPLPNIEASGGNTAVSGGYKYHVITSTGSFQLIANPENKKFEAFLIAGGGGGGNGGDMWGGGGGAGGAVHIGTQYGFPLSIATHPVTIGAGGGATNKGGDTTFAPPGGSTIVADGGGYGSGRQCVPNSQGQPGGSAGGAGIEGTASVYVTQVNRLKSDVTTNVNIVKTTIMIDLTGLKDGGTAGDIIGKDGAGVAFIGQVTTANQGTVFGVTMTCLETPAGGDTDIDLFSATEGTGVNDTAIGDLTETQIINAGAASAGTVVAGGDIAADQFLYLVSQGTGDATYTAGRFLIEITGFDAAS